MCHRHSTNLNQISWPFETKRSSDVLQTNGHVQPLPICSEVNSRACLGVLYWLGLLELWAKNKVCMPSLMGESVPLAALVYFLCRYSDSINVASLSIVTLRVLMKAIADAIELNIPSCSVLFDSIPRVRVSKHNKKIFKSASKGQDKRFQTVASFLNKASGFSGAP